MKKLLFCFIACLTMLLFSCNKQHYDPKDISDQDSTYVIDQLKKIDNQQFTSFEMVSNYQQDCITRYTTDSIFRSIPLKILEDVYTVCSYKFKNVTKKTIVQEYSVNKDVYLNIHKKPKEVKTIDELFEEKETITDTINNTAWIILKNCGRVS